MSEDNKAIARKVYEIVSTGDFGRAEEIVDTDAPDNELLADDPPAKLIDTFKETFAEAREGFPDLGITIEDLIFHSRSLGELPRRSPLLGTPVNTVVLPGGNRRVFGVVFPTELFYPPHILLRGRRGRRAHRRERPPRPYLAKATLEGRRDGREARARRVRRSVSPREERSLGYGENRTGRRRERTIGGQ